MKISLRKDPGDDPNDINRRLCQAFCLFRGIEFFSFKEVDEGVEGMSVHLMCGRARQGAEAEVRDSLKAFLTALETDLKLARRTELDINDAAATSA